MSATPMDRLNAALSGRYHIERELGAGAGGQLSCRAFEDSLDALDSGVL